MERFKWIVVIVVAVTMGMFSFISRAETSSPVGYWKTTDETGKVKSIIQIFQTSDNTLVGKVVKFYPEQNVCTACTDQRRNQPVVGMVILSSLQQSEGRWNKGEFLNVENGKNYNCSIKLGENGKKLIIEGHTAFPFFGRSETWERVDLLSGQDEIG